MKVFWKLFAANIWVVISVILLTDSLTLAGEKSSEKKGVELSGVIDGQSYSLIASNRPLIRSEGKGNAVWGDFGGNDNDVVSYLRFKFAGKNIKIPANAYSDLGNADLNSIKVAQVASQLCITIRGGDGSGSYESRIVIKDRHVVMRETAEGSLSNPKAERQLIEFDKSN